MLSHTLFLVLERKDKVSITEGVKYIELDLKEKEKTKLIAELVNLVAKSSRIKDGETSKPGQETPGD